jgi:hypothetical protein
VPPQGPAGAGAWRPPTQGPFVYQPPVHRLAIIGFIAAFVLPVLGFVLSVIAVFKVCNDPARHRGKGLALAGVVISLFAMLTCGGLTFRG